MTYAERFKAMTDEQLAKFLMDAHDCVLHVPFCQDKQECCDNLDDIKEENCMACMMAWPRKEVD